MIERIPFSVVVPGMVLYFEYHYIVMIAGCHVSELHEGVNEIINNSGRWEPLYVIASGLSYSELSARVQEEIRFRTGSTYYASGKFMCVLNPDTRVPTLVFVRSEKWNLNTVRVSK